MEVNLLGEKWADVTIMIADKLDSNQNQRR